MSEVVLPSSWAFAYLESCVDILDSKRMPVNNAERFRRIEGKNESELYPYYGATGEVGKIDSYLFDDELIALGEDGVPFLDGSKSKAYWLKGKTWVNNHAHVLKGIPRVVSNGYLLSFLNQFDYQGYVNGGTRLKLTQKSMRKIPISIAPLAEQKEIAAQLDTLLAQVDNIKTRLDAIPAILKRFRQSLLAAAVSGKLTEEWRGTEQYLPLSEAFVVPVDWKQHSLNDVVEYITSGSRGWAKYYSEAGALFIRSQDINTDELVINDAAFVALPENVEGKRTKVKVEDLLVTITGANVTRCARVKANYDDAYISQHVALIRLREPSSAIFIELVLKAENAGRKQLTSMAYGGGKPGLNLQNLKDVMFAIPPTEEQTEIVRRVDQLFAFADQIETQVSNAQSRVNNLTQSILAKAFRGELTADWRAEHPELISGEHSAEALLARIKAEQATLSAKKTPRTRRKPSA